MDAHERIHYRHQDLRIRRVLRKLSLVAEVPRPLDVNGSDIKTLYWAKVG
jgi:hypothetical protein